MIEIAGIDHLVLRTTQLERMLTFYAGVLGCAVEQQSSVEFGLTQLRAGNAMIDLVTVDSTLGRAGGAAPGLPGGISGPRPAGLRRPPAAPAAGPRPGRCGTRRRA